MMRWIWVLGVVGVLLALAGCSEDEAQAPRAGLLVFSYDAVRDVVVVSTRPITREESTTPALYADRLETYGEVMPTPDYRLLEPQATVQGNTAVVNFQGAITRGTLSSAQLANAQASLQGWYWVPGVTQVSFQVRGEPLALPQMGPFPQPAPPTFHTFVFASASGEVAYLVGSLMPRTLAEAIELLNTRQIREFPATRGFQPLLPEGMTVTANPAAIADGVLAVNLPAAFPREGPRLAGVVLHLTQFPQVRAVRFTFGGETVAQPYMRGNLNAPFRPYDLLLPSQAATAATAEQEAAVRASLRAALGRDPASFGPVRIYQDWALVTVVPEQGGAEEIVVLQRREADYVIQTRGQTLLPGPVIGYLPTAPIIAFRLPGWEVIALQEESRR